MTRDSSEAHPDPSIELWTFGFKHGPFDAGLVVDVRFLPNPYYVPELCHMTGKDAPCAAYVFKDPSTSAFVQSLADTVLALNAALREQGKRECKVAVGYTGGRHRSVAVVEALAKSLEVHGLSPIVRHREL